MPEFTDFIADLTMRVQRLEEQRETEKAALLDAFAQIDKLQGRLDFQYTKIHRLEEAMPTNTSESDELEEYRQRSDYRFQQMDGLEKLIDFNDFSWRQTEKGRMWERLMAEQHADEAAMGL